MLLSILVGLCLLLSSRSAVAESCQWQALPGAPLAARIDDIYFVDAQRGWTANSSGQIHRTLDGGASWTEQLQTFHYFRSIEFIDDQHGFAGTLQSDAVLFETTDGGLNWSVVSNLPTPAPLRICGLAIPDASTIYACGAFDGPPVIMKSGDAGASWSSSSLSAIMSSIVDVHFFDADNGFIVGGAVGNQLGSFQAIVLETVDGGQNWTQRYLGSDIGEWGWKIWFLSRQIGYVSVENPSAGKILKTIDGGLTWVESLVPGNTNLQSIAFLTQELGWVGGNSISTTLDGGQTWQAESWGSHLNRFFDVGGGVLYASGFTVYKLDCAAATALTPLDTPLHSPLQLRSDPSPFNSTTVIGYVLPTNTRVLVRIYDSLGRMIRTLLNEEQTPGPHSVAWDATDDSGRTMPSNVYQLRIDAAGTAESRSVVLVK